MIRRLDDFPAQVTRFLAARAGHACCVCHAPTSGPGAAPTAVINDGVAAHITAASPAGPRYDPSLSLEQRKAADNGIWVCTKHGREIDSVASTYSVESLRGLKRIREDKAAEQLPHRVAGDDHSKLLIDFPYVQTTFKLFEIIHPQPYNYPTASALRDLIVTSPLGPRVLNLIPEVIVGTWESHPNVAGILATLLSNATQHWHPAPQIVEKLRDLCASAILTDDWSRVASVEPLAFAIASRGSSDMQRRVLERIVSSTNWRKQDIARVREYYGTLGVELAAIVRHWNDPFRKGLLRANDVGRLMDLVLSNDKLIKTSPGQQDLLNLLLDHARVLSDSGAKEMAQSVADFVNAFRLLGANPEKSR
jgi:hypothetical protein